MKKLTRSGVEALRQEMPILSRAMQSEIVGGVGSYSAGDNYLAYDTEKGYYINPHYSNPFYDVDGNMVSSGNWTGGYYIKSDQYDGDKVRYIPGYYEGTDWIAPVYDESGNMLESGYFDECTYIQGYFELVDNPRGNIGYIGMPDDRQPEWGSGGGYAPGMISGNMISGTMISNYYNYCGYNVSDGYYIAGHYVDGYRDDATGQYVEGYYVSGHFQQVQGANGEQLYYVPAHYREGYRKPGIGEASGEWVPGEFIEGQFVSVFEKDAGNVNSDNYYWGSGNGAGTSMMNPYSKTEFWSLLNNNSWHGGFVEDMGYVIGMISVIAGADYHGSVDEYISSLGSSFWDALANSALPALTTIPSEYIRNQQLELIAGLVRNGINGPIYIKHTFSPSGSSTDFKTIITAYDAYTGSALFETNPDWGSGSGN